VPAGKTFTLDGHNLHQQRATDPVTGTGAVTNEKTAPKLTWAGATWFRAAAPLQRSREIGAAYIGDPKVAVTLAGTAWLHLRGHALLQRRGHELHD